MARPIPDELVRAQCSWYRLLDRIGASQSAPTTEQRRCLLQLQVFLRWHPYFQRVDDVPSARWELRRQALAALRARGELRRSHRTFRRRR